MYLERESWIPIASSFEYIAGANQTWRLVFKHALK